MKQGSAIISILCLVILSSAFMVFLFRMMEIPVSLLHSQNVVPPISVLDEKQLTVRALEDMQAENPVMETDKTNVMRALEEMQKSN